MIQPEIVIFLGMFVVLAIILELYLFIAPAPEPKQEVHSYYRAYTTISQKNESFESNLTATENITHIDCVIANESDSESMTCYAS
jgi:hypothetical protein